MRHRKATVKLNRTSSHRKAMFRNMVTSLFKYERITTTDAKAKALRGWADHLITLAKRGDLHARRQALAIVKEKQIVHELFQKANERFGKTSGGYTRIIKSGLRPGDSAPMSIIELVDTKKAKKEKKQKPARVEKTGDTIAKKADDKELSAKTSEAEKSEVVTDSVVYGQEAEVKTESTEAEEQPLTETEEDDEKDALEAEASDQTEDSVQDSETTPSEKSSKDTEEEKKE